MQSRSSFPPAFPASPLGSGSFEADAVVPVSVLNRAIGTMLERSFPLVWVSGEVSNFTRAASGHWYFSIKDAQAQMRCVMFRGRAQYAEFIPREGDKIEVRALVTMYEPRGELQLNVEAVRRTGHGRACTRRSCGSRRSSRPKACSPPSASARCRRIRVRSASSRRCRRRRCATC